MRPGNTSLPVTSITSLALVGKMSLCTAAILPLRMATSLIPSMPEAGQITRPPRRSWSKVALIDMNNLPCLRRRRYSRPEYEAYFVFYKSKLHAMIARGEAHRIELLASMFRGWGECVAESKRASWRDQTSPVATVRTTGLSDPPAASDSRRAVPGSVRKIRGDAAAIQPAFGACGTENRRSDHVGGRYRAGQDDDDRRAQAAGRPQFCREGRR